MRVLRNTQALYGSIDLDGLSDSLVLDADGDTSISAPTDDQIDIEVNGADTYILRDTLDIVRTAHAQIRKLTPVTKTTAGAVTYTIAEMLDGLILRDPNGAGRSDVTPTAADMVAGVSGVAVADTFELRLVNTADAAETITLTAGVGVTLVPATVTIAQNEASLLLVRFTNVTGASEAVTIYAMNAGG